MHRVDDNILWAFISGDLDSEACEEVKLFLQRDAALRARYMEMRSIVGGVQYWSRADSLSRVKSVIRNEERKKRWRRILVVILVLLSLVIASFMISHYDKGPRTDVQHLYATHFNTMSLPGLPRNDEVGRIGSDISAAYTLGEFGKVVEFDRLGLENELPPTAQLAMAISLMRKSDFDRAEIHLERLMSKNTLLDDHAMWYLVLLNMTKQGAVDVQALELIARDPQNDRQEDAQNLLDALE